MDDKELREFYKMAKAVKRFWDSGNEEQIVNRGICVYCDKNRMNKEKISILCKKHDKIYDKYYKDLGNLAVIAQGSRSFKEFVRKTIEKELKHG